jgi:hypothetical protein
MERERSAARGPRASRLLVAVAMTASLIVAACGGGGGGGDGGPDYGKVVAAIQATFGTSMLDSSIEGDTITVTIDNNFSAAGAKLFMCSNIITILENNGATAATVIIVNERGDELSSSIDCL